MNNPMTRALLRWRARQPWVRRNAVVVGGGHLGMNFSLQLPTILVIDEFGG